MASNGPCQRFKCSACRVVGHRACKDKIAERLACKRTFFTGDRNYRDNVGKSVYYQKLFEQLTTILSDESLHLSQGISKMASPSALSVLFA